MESMLTAEVAASNGRGVQGDLGLLNAIVAACPSALLLFRDSGELLFASAAAERLFGCGALELCRRNVDALVHVDPVLRPSRALSDYARRCEPARLGLPVEGRARRDDGSEAAVEVVLVRRAELQQCTLAHISDIASRKQRESETAARVQELEQSNADLEQFASIASHDLREPLRMVVSYTRLLAEGYRGRLDAKADKFIGYASQGAERMQRLIDDLLEYARLDNAGRPSQPTPLADALEDTLSDMRVLIQDSGAQIVHGELPTVRVDPVQLAQLLQNLIHNAIKFRRNEPPRVEISATREGASWRIEVRDNGIGIERRYQERIFQMFQRLHERNKYEGSGIGLATARKIVERHGGSIGLTSTPGSGSTFFFTLPAHD